MKFKESYEINIKLENLYVCPTQDITQYSYSRQISSMIVLKYLHFGREGCSPCPLWTHLCLLQWQGNDFENCDKTTRKYIQNAVSLLFFFFLIMASNKVELQVYPDPEQLHGCYYLLTFWLTCLLWPCKLRHPSVILLYIILQYHIIYLFI